MVENLLLAASLECFSSATASEVQKAELGLFSRAYSMAISEMGNLRMKKRAQTCITSSKNETWVIASFRTLSTFSKEYT
jgi:hypothetical protein